MHCHNFSQYCFDLTNSVKSISNGFQSFSDNVKRDILLYGDSRLDANKNKLILEAIITYIKKLKSSLDPFLDKISYIHRKPPNN